MKPFGFTDMWGYVAYGSPGLWDIRVVDCSGRSARDSERVGGGLLSSSEIRARGKKGGFGVWGCPAKGYVELRSWSVRCPVLCGVGVVVEGEPLAQAHLSFPSCTVPVRNQPNQRRKLDSQFCILSCNKQSMEAQVLFGCLVACRACLVFYFHEQNQILVLSPKFAVV